MAVSAAVVKELREKTGAGMMDCKAALEACNGSFQEAEDWLRKKGISAAAKKAGRAAADGVISAKLFNNDTRAVLVEVNCETDFVAKTDDFKNLVAHVSEIVATLPELPADAAGLPESVELMRAATVGKLGENMLVKRFARHDMSGTGKLQLYIHPGDKLVVLLDIGCEKSDTLLRPEFLELAADVAMQIAAVSPVAVDRTRLPQSIVDHEMEIAKEQARQTGKPEAVIEKIALGKMDKIYADLCLLEQPFVKDQKNTVAEHTAAVGKLVGDTITMRDFIRYKLGE